MIKISKIFMIPLFIFILIFAGCTQSNKDEDVNNQQHQSSGDDTKLTPLNQTETVVIAEDGSASGAGFYIAKEKGYFEDYNIKVKFVTFGNSDEMLPAVAAGEVDVAGGISSASFFNSIAQGIDVRMIADKGHNIEGNSYFSFVIRKDLQDEIKEYKDFKGKRIAVSTRNAVDDYIFERMLKHAGLTRDEVEFTLMSDFGNMMSALGNQSIDAALQIEPLITQGMENGIHVRFGDTTDYAPKAQIAMVLGSPNFLEERRDVATRFMAAYLKGVRDYNDILVKGKGNKEDLIQIMTEYTALKDPSVWEKVAVTGLNPNGRMYVEDIKKQYQMYKENGAISAELDFNKVVDLSLVEDVLDMIGEY